MDSSLPPSRPIGDALNVRREPEVGTPATNARDRFARESRSMKVYVLTDMEGVAGVISFDDYVGPEGRYY
ncbi:MAG TPA: hypothetical protein PLD23_21800, partial [Armatimonadota bacterium]|nr:hypothetical protein [Armatimonadota bacterium]